MLYTVIYWACLLAACPERSWCISLSSSLVDVLQGAGAGIARRFAREGYAVALVSRSKETLHPITEEIVKFGGQALAVPADTGEQPC